MYAYMLVPVHGLHRFLYILIDILWNKLLISCAINFQLHKCLKCISVTLWAESYWVHKVLKHLPVSQPQWGACWFNAQGTCGCGNLAWWWLKNEERKCQEINSLVGLCVHVCVYICVCVHLCICVCASICVCLCVYLCMHVCVHLSSYLLVCAFVFMFACVFVCAFVFMFACVFVHVFARAFVFVLTWSLTPCSYNMVGHLKFCLTLLGGFFLFSEHLEPLQVFGLLTTLSGKEIIWLLQWVYIAYLTLAITRYSNPSNSHFLLLAENNHLHNLSSERQVYYLHKMRNPGDTWSVLCVFSFVICSWSPFSEKHSIN